MKVFIYACFASVWFAGAVYALSGTGDNGYTFTDSTEADGPDFYWVDITDSGEKLFNPGAANQPRVDLPVPAVWLGGVDSQLSPNKGGFLSPVIVSDFTNDCPVSSAAQDRLLVFHDQLGYQEQPADNNIHYQYFPVSPHPHADSPVTVFSWINVSPNGSALRISFQALLFANGDILYQYDIPDGVGNFGASASIGMIRDSGSGSALAVQYSCDSPTISDELAILFQPPEVEVTTTDDELDPPGAGGTTSLREAIRDVPDGGRIVFDGSLSGLTTAIQLGVPESTFFLNKTVFIDASGLEEPFGITGANSDPLFAATSSSAFTYLSNLRLSQGMDDDAGPEGGAFFSGTGQGACFHDIDFAGNRAVGGNSAGGAVSIVGHKGVAFSRCRFRENQAVQGGALHLQTITTARIDYSEFSGNQAERGGAVTLEGVGDLQVTNSSFFDNVAYGSGAGDGGGALLIRDSQGSVVQNTFSRNMARAQGGAIGFSQLLDSLSLSLTSNTFYGNSSPGPGGALYAEGSDLSDITLQLNAFQSNHAGSGSQHGSMQVESGNNIDFISLGNNLADDDPAALTEATDIVDTAAGLSPLGTHGGFGLTHVPLVGSALIDASGEFVSPAGQATDQRGFTRGINGEGGGNPYLDIGAVEAGTVITVTTAVDENSVPVGPDISLREAIHTVIPSLGGSTRNGVHVRFDPSLSGATLDLGNSNIFMPDDISIILDASNLTDPVHVTATNSVLIATSTNSRAHYAFHGMDFSGGDPAFFVRVPLTLSDATIRDCVSSGLQAGGIITTSSLVLHNTRFLRNFGPSGAVYSSRAPFTRVSDSYFRGNEARSGSGGALQVVAGGLTVFSSTFYDNHAIGASRQGGAISYTPVLYAGGLRLFNSTFSQNHAGLSGGAIHTGSGFNVASEIRGCLFYGNTDVIAGAFMASPSIQIPITLSHTLFAANVAGSVERTMNDGTSFVSEGYNLIRQENPSGIFTHPQDILDSEPWLGPLGTYGGNVLTHHPLAISPVIDAGGAGNTLTAFRLGPVDARGAPRGVDGDGDNTPAMDIGPVEVAEPLFVTSVKDGLDTPAGREVSLREALRDVPDGGRILFSPAVFDGGSAELDLSSDTSSQNTELLINTSVVVDGTGLPRGILLRGPDMDRVVNIISPSAEDPIQVALLGISVTEGNAAGTTGGGIRVQDARLTLYAGSIFDNTAGTGGGGMLINNSEVILDHVSIHENVALDQGGAIFSFNPSALELRHSTVWSNTSFNQGAGFQLFETDLMLFSSLVASNLRNNGVLANAALSNSPVSSRGYNMTDGNFFSGPDDIVNTPALMLATVDPGAGWAAEVVVPDAGSPIVNNGPPGLGAPLVDARSAARRFGLVDGRRRMDIGAFELGPEIADMDNDNMDDYWEQYYGLDFNNTADGQENDDYDNDTNLEEYQNQTHPGFAESPADPLLTATVIDDSSGNILITFRSTPGFIYHGRHSNDLTLPRPWPSIDAVAGQPDSFFTTIILQPDEYNDDVNNPDPLGFFYISE